VNHECFDSRCITVVRCTALRVHLSESAHNALSEFPGFRTTPRGETVVKVTRIIIILLYIRALFYAYTLCSLYSYRQCSSNENVFTRDSSPIACLSHRSSVCLSVCLSVTQVNQSKTVRDRITEFSVSAAWKTLVLESVKFFHKFERGHPEQSESAK